MNMDGWNAEAFDRWLTTEPEYESEYNPRREVAEMIEQASDLALVKLRDRIGMLSDNDRANAFQRLTWIWTTTEAVTLMNRAITDVMDIKI
jgi:hypothetical protein